MGSKDTSLVSVIIRARNEEAALKRLLPVINNQKTNFAFDVWVLDNDSQDGTAAVAKSFSAQVHTIPQNEFNYATALNMGARLGHGSIIVNLSAHCIPQNETWLAHLVKPLLDDETVIATYGRQWFNPKTSPYTAESNEPFFPHTPEQRLLVAFSNANAAIRKETALKHPFNPYIKILEDHLFYLELSSPTQFKYVPEALVHHGHHDFLLRYHLKRWLLEGWAFHFILKQRQLASPFKTTRFFQRDVLRSYARLGKTLYRAGQRKAGLLAVPFFLTREIFWTLGWLQGRLTCLQTAKQDRDFQQDNSSPRRNPTGGNRD